MGAQCRGKEECTNKLVPGGHKDDNLRSFIDHVMLGVLIIIICSVLIHIFLTRVMKHHNFFHFKRQCSFSITGNLNQTIYIVKINIIFKKVA